MEKWGQGTKSGQRDYSRLLGGGREVWVDFEELNARGWAEVIEERPCPKIAEGPGRVVTATITHGENSQPFAETVWVLADV